MKNPFGFVRAWLRGDFARCKCCGVDADGLIQIARLVNRCTGWTTPPVGEGLTQEQVLELAHALENAGHILSEHAKNTLARKAA